jgi:hypothetical protein
VGISVKNRQESLGTIEEQDVAIIDYSIEPAATLTNPRTKLSRGLFDQHEGSKYQIEHEGKRESLRFQARKI